MRYKWRFCFDETFKEVTTLWHIYVNVPKNSLESALNMHMTLKVHFMVKSFKKNKYYCNFHFGKEINLLKENDLLMSVGEKSEQL